MGHITRVTTFFGRKAATQFDKWDGRNVGKYEGAHLHAENWSPLIFKITNKENHGLSTGNVLG
jgi:hypothetical protein